MQPRALFMAVLMFAGIHCASAATVGEREVAVPVSERNAILHVTVWYPAAPGGHTVVVGGNAVFRGTSAFGDAPPRNGRFPLILIVHGGLRAAPNVASWLASALAARGFVAVVVNPPAIPAGPAKQSVLSELWLRPADLSATITAIEKQPMFAERINTEKIGGVGFFLGGYSMLALAGARLDPKAYMRSCDGSGLNIDCAWLLKGGVDLHLADAARLGRSHRDPRLKAAIIVDPELKPERRFDRGLRPQSGAS